MELVMSGRPPVGINTSRPHPARMYDWYLGGKDNYPVDETMGKQMLDLGSAGRRENRVRRRPGGGAPPRAPSPCSP
ncbi:SAM-dependent methyltransferase [Streptomyces sp. TG1A-60]|uniref:SAM-dependent methyltransferase n=1 Tax=Streptomyces sp. TG1A-60 TaxID=3129111 RepID=UPI0030CD54D9